MVCVEVKPLGSVTMLCLIFPLGSWTPPSHPSEYFLLLQPGKWFVMCNTQCKEQIKKTVGIIQLKMVWQMIMITMKTMIWCLLLMTNVRQSGQREISRQSPPYTSTMPTFYSGIPSTHLYIHVHNKLCVIRKYTYILYITCKDINIVYSLSSCYTLCKSWDSAVHPQYWRLFWYPSIPLERLRVSWEEEKG